MSPFGVGTVLRLERDARSMVRRLRRATNEYPPPSPLYIGWVGVGWRRRCETRLLSLRELDNEGYIHITVSCFFFCGRHGLRSI